MTTRDYGTASESKKPTTKIEEHDCSDCVYRMKKLNKNGGKIYVWFRICVCDEPNLEDRLEEYNSISKGDGLPQSYSKDGIHVHYAKACTYRTLRELPNWVFKIEEECHCEKRLPKGRLT